MKKEIVHDLVAILVMTLFNVVLQLLWVPVIGGVTYILMLLFDILLYWYANKRYYGFIHSTLMTTGVAGIVWLGIWDVKQLISFIKAWPNPMEVISISDSLYMILVGICAAGLYILGIYYLGLQKDGES